MREYRWGLLLVGAIVLGVVGAGLVRAESGTRPHDAWQLGWFVVGAVVVGVSGGIAFRLRARSPRIATSGLLIALIVGGLSFAAVIGGPSGDADPGDHRRSLQGFCTGAVCAAWALGCAQLWKARKWGPPLISPDATHRVEVIAGDGRFYAECECGWFTDDYRTRDDAFAAARRHTPHVDPVIER